MTVMTPNVVLRVRRLVVDAGVQPGAFTAARQAELEQAVGEALGQALQGGFGGLSGFVGFGGSGGPMPGRATLAMVIAQAVAPHVILPSGASADAPAVRAGAPR